MAAPITPGVLTVSSAFVSSIQEAHIYPRNLVEKHAYSATLEAYHDRLDKTSGTLFVQNEQDSELPIRDLDESTGKFVKHRVRSLNELRQHHGQHHQSSQNQRSVTFSKKDPKCRFIFLHGNTSRAPLNVTRIMMLELLSFHQVMPGYLDLLFLFGESRGPNDLRFSAFREQSSLDVAAVSPKLESLGRSGRQYELCYNLKTVDDKNSDPCTPDWSIRQAALYHKLDMQYGNSVWIITKGNLELKERVQELTGKNGKNEDRLFNTVDDCLRSSLAVHAMMVHWASDTWRWHLQWLDERIEAETQNVVYGTREKFQKARKWYTDKDLQTVQRYEDQVREACIAIDGNIKVMIALQKFYEGIAADQSLLLSTICGQAIRLLSKQIHNAVYDLEMQSSRGKALVEHARERKVLILQYVQAQAAEVMEGLTKSAYDVGVSAQNEAIVMRIITAVTLIFLPATFVSTFFSTDVVKYQSAGGVQQSSTGGAGDTSYSALAMRRWIQVSLPLTSLTVVVAIGIYVWEKRRQSRKRYKNGLALGIYNV